MNDDILDFFLKELWEPSLRPLEIGMVTSDIYHFELEGWLYLGSMLGLFDAAVVNGILDAGHTVTLDFMAEVQDALEMVETPTTDGNSSIFRTHMLLTSELMSDEGAVSFLEALALGNDYWDRVVDGNKAWLGSIELICSGFGRVLAHIETVSAINPEDKAESSIHTVLASIQSKRLGITSVGVPRYFRFANTALSQSALDLGTISEREIFRALYLTLRKWNERFPTRREQFVIDPEECWREFVINRGGRRNTSGEKPTGENPKRRFEH